MESPGEVDGSPRTRSRIGRAQPVVRSTSAKPSFRGIGEALIERNDFEQRGTAFRRYEGRRQLQCVGRPQRVTAKKSHRTLGEIMLIATEVATPLRACYRSGRNQFSLEGRQMQFGFSPPVSGPLSSPDNLARIASEGEGIGYDYATLSHHVLVPRGIA